MPVYSAVAYSKHAESRMRKRHFSRQDIELALRIGEGYEEDDGTRVYELENIQVVIVERGSTAHVVTVMRLRSHT